MSVIRPAAPARHIVSKFIPVLQLPPVTAAPRIGSLYFGSFEASVMVMSFQDASSSSATSCAMVLAMCWPMSALPTVTAHFAVVADRVPDARLEIGGWSPPSVPDLGRPT